MSYWWLHTWPMLQRWRSGRSGIIQAKLLHFVCMNSQGMAGIYICIYIYYRLAVLGLWRYTEYTIIWILIDIYICIIILIFVFNKCIYIYIFILQLSYICLYLYIYSWYIYIYMCLINVCIMLDLVYCFQIVYDILYLYI